MTREPPSYLIAVYLAYALGSLTLIGWLARVLYRNGEVFLRDAFADTPEVAHAINQLLVVGFFLISLGYAALTLRGTEVMSATRAIELLSEKLGALLITLGVVHLFNMYLFNRFRRRASLRRMAPPVEPQMELARG